jgi:hypothetical protein
MGFLDIFQSRRNRHLIAISLPNSIDIWWSILDTLLTGLDGLTFEAVAGWNASLQASSAGDDTATPTMRRADHHCFCQRSSSCAWSTHTGFRASLAKPRRPRGC